MSNGIEPKRERESKAKDREVEKFFCYAHNRRERKKIILPHSVLCVQEF